MHQHRELRLSGTHHDDGSRRTVALAAGEIGPEPVHARIAPADIAGVAIADSDGRIWCQAHFVCSVRRSW